MAIWFYTCSVLAPHDVRVYYNQVFSECSKRNVRLEQQRRFNRFRSPLFEFISSFKHTSWMKLSHIPNLFSTYQALVDDVLDHRLNRVTVQMDGKNGQGKRPKTYDVDPENVRIPL